jgi:hypothetical protein
VNEWLRRRPVGAAVTLAVAAVAAYASYRIGRVLLLPTEGLPEDQRSLLGRLVAWPAGTFMPLGLGATTLSVLLIPDGRFDGPWRWRFARVAWWTTVALAVLQLLDDHLLDQPGTSNPSGIAIPYPVQDLAELPLLVVLAVTLGYALFTLPARVRRRAPR